MICYLMLAASNQNNIIKLINSLDCDNVQFIVHIDKKFNIHPDLYKLSIINTNVNILDNRQNCNWSGYSLVTAMLKLLEEAVKTTPCNTIFQFLSDSCIAVKNAELIRNELINRGTNIHFWGKLKNDHITHMKPKSYRNYWLYDFKYLNYKNYRSSHTKKLIQYLELIIRTILLPFKKDLPSYICKGSQWFSITKEDWIKIHKGLTVDFYSKFKTARAPDEMFFQSAMAYSKLSTDLNNKSVSDNIYANHWIDWSNPKRGPKVLGEEDTKNIMKIQEALFARKIPA